MNFAAHNISIDPNGASQQKTTCPQCSAERKKKKEKCLSVNLAKGIWHCHHCGWKGSLLTKEIPHYIQTLHKGKFRGNDTQVPEFHLQLRPFTESELEYWITYHITESLLARYQVHSVTQYAASTPDGKAYNVEATPANPIFAYQLGENREQLSVKDSGLLLTKNWALITSGSFKLYRPHALRNRFRHLGTRPKDFVFGYAQLPASGPLVILTGGEKDVLTFAYLGQPAICLNSETALPSPQVVAELKARFQIVAVCYDTDQTGQRMASKLAQDYDLALLELPPMQPGHKDISDYIAHQYPIEELLARLQALPQPQLSASVIDTLPPFGTMLNRLSQEPETPMVYLGMPPVAMGYIVGPPKSGKTTFCEGLAFSMAAGAESYLGHSLHLDKRKVILFSLEEFWRNRLQRNQKQIQRLIPPHGKAWLNQNVLTVDETFPRNLLTQEDWDLLTQQIEIHKPSVVFIDSLSRLYNGSIEDSRVAQALTRQLRQLVQDYQILLILIHHTPKQLGRPLTIDSIAGSRILAQEADFALGISKSPSGQRYLKPIFYRYAPEPEDVQLLQFSNDLWLEATGTASETELLALESETPSPDFPEELLAFIEEHCQIHLHIETKALFKAFVQTGEVSKPTLHHHIKRLIREGLIVKLKHGQYALPKLNS